MAKRTLTLSGEPGSYTAILNGQDISKGIRRLSIDVGPNDWPRVEAELAIHAIEVIELGVKDSRFEVSMPDEARAALIALGWTPPAQPAPGEPAEIVDLPTEVRHLVHAVDRMRDDWAESDPDHRHNLWGNVHAANEAVWNRHVKAQP